MEKKPRYVSENRFTFERDDADSLRLEISTLSPIDQSRLKILTERIFSIFVDKFGIYSRPDILEEVRGIEDRVYIVNNEDFQNMYNNWDQVKRWKKGTKRIIGAAFREGNLVLMKDPRNIWGMLSRRSQTNLTRAFENEQEAQSQLVKTMWVNTIAHELTHNLQYIILPYTFYECGARYYAREIANELNCVNFTDSLEDERINFYHSLISKYGDIVHRLFFGSHTKIEGGFDLVTKIYEEMTPELDKKLFPNDH